MDALPKTLVSLIGIVVEQYKELSWTSLEQNGKMKISLTWSNDVFKAKKSKAARKRDKNRLEQFIENKPVENIPEQQTELSDENHKLESEIPENSDIEMDISDNMKSPYSASSQVNTSSRTKVKTGNNTIESINIVQNKVVEPVDNKRSEGQVFKALDSSKYKVVEQPKQKPENQPCSTHNPINSTINRVNEIPISDRTLQSEIPNGESEQISKPRTKRRFFSKIVMKTTSGARDTLIGKLPDKDFVIVHKISESKTELIDTYEREWKYYFKNVDEDFKDVSDTDFMDDRVVAAIRKMELYVARFKLYAYG